MIEKEITKFEKEICFNKKLNSETELKEFSDLQKKAYSPRLQKSIGLENRILRAKKLLYNN
jgi:hypothetical protein